MRALVTGGAGFVGSHLVDELLKNGYEVKVLIRPTSNLSYLEGKPVILVTGDLFDSSSLIAACENTDVVFHIAALPHEQRHLPFFYGVNTRGTQNLLEASHNTAIQRFVLMSTTSIYGFPPTPVLKEEDATMPRTKYARSKYLAEQLLWHYGKKDHMHVAAVRAPWITGPRNYKAPRFIRTIQQGRFFYVDTPLNTISMVDVRDVAACLRLIAEHPGANNQALNVKSFDCPVQSYIETYTTALSIFPPTKILPMNAALFLAGCAEATYLLAGREPPLSRHQIKTLGTTRTFDITKVMALGYIPRYTMKETIADTVTWMHEHTDEEP
jgi:nucleoside-diphosphate-sugar epimerase